MTIDLAAGMPGYIGNTASGTNAPQGHWWYEDTNSSAAYATPGYSESGSSIWQQVGLPYDANVTRTFINQTSGGGQGSLDGQENWYRLHFTVDPSYVGKKFALEIEGAHTGVQVYINGTLLPGVSQVAADSQATHVVGFIPVVVDLTPYLHTDGTTDNVIAIDVSRGASWFETPGFSGAFRFGQAMAGLFRGMKLMVTNPVHIPLDVYSNQKTWGTYVGTVSEVPAAQGTATAASAVLEVETNVLNETTTTQQVTLTTQIVDAIGNVVVTAPPVTQAVAPMTPGNFPSSPQPLFDQQITIQNPTLWYPNNSTYGTPYMYRVYHIISVNGVVVDSAQSPLGIRTITWDNNFPYFNGHAMHLWGGSGRYDYPALGSSVPEEQQWRDLAQIAAEGGNIWRPGHSTSSEEFVNAADAYGIMVIQPSGDGEGAFTNPSADDSQLKQELHRDMIIRDRSHPSILYWEEDNGGNNPNLAAALGTLGTQWDAINPRVQASRAYLPSYAFIDECDGAGCEVGNKGSYPNNPAFGAEYWDSNGTARGLAWDYELAFAAPFLDSWRKGRVADTFGTAQWYFADTPGENSIYIEFANQANNMQNYVRSLGMSSTDQSRFPKLLYYIYQANWLPYQLQPVVHLAHHWNRSYEYTPGTPIQENAFSNCPSVRLLINGAAKDPVTGAPLADQTPNPWNVNSSADLTQSTTAMPGQVHWMVNWAPGTVTAECIDANGNPVSGVIDSRTSAGAESRIVLTVVPELTRPNGTSFQWTANGSDAAFVQAAVVDAQGNLVPTAADNVTFTVSGPANYMGGTQQYVADPSWTNDYQDAFSQANSSVIPGVPYAFFHAPGDPELNFEGGLQKVALRSTFTPGTVTVTASAPGLATGSVQLTSVAPSAPVQTQAPAIIVPPVSTSVTAGYPATFTVAASGSGTLTYQWYVNGDAIAGATGTSFSTGATTLSQNGESVSVTVTSSYGTVSSTAVLLTVASPANVTITTQPTSQTATVGQQATLTVAATGSPQLNYAWYGNGTQVAFGAQNSYTTPVLSAAGTESFYVIVSNPLSQVQSATAVLTVAAPAPVSFTTQPASQIVAMNQPVQFSAVVSGSSPYSYQWQFTPAGGQATILVSNTQVSSSINYTIAAMTSASVGTYTLMVNNAAGVAVTSAPAQLTLAPPGINIAFAQPATASSTQGACTDPTTAPPYTGLNCLGAENAVDGNLSTRWGSAVADAPPTPAVPGVDPSYLVVDLGSAQSFNTLVINWEAAYAAQYEIDYTNSDPTSASTVWTPAFVNKAGTGGNDTENFPTVQGRYIRLNNQLRGTQYGYSVNELQVYNVSQCGGSGERFSINSNSSQVLDNLLGETWTRTVTTDTTPGSQFTGVNAAAYCKSIGMRLPTEAEALNIGGNNNASCAFPGAWNTWTSTVDPNDSTETAIVGFDGSASQKVTSNWPGETLCVSGASSAQAPTITSAPQSATVSIGQAAMFTVAATGTPTPSYQWMENGSPIAGATNRTYITPVTALTDSGEVFTVTVSNGNGSITSSPATLTVSNAPVIPPSGGGGTPAPSAPPYTGPSSADFFAFAAGNSTGTGDFAPDADFTGGGTYSNFGTAVNTAGTAHAAPAAVYQSERAGDFTYTLGTLTPGTSYSGYLHFAEIYFSSKGQRVFDVAVNGAPLLTNFDIVAAAGGPFIAYVVPFTAQADANGKITIAFTAGSQNQPKVSGIELLANTPVVNASAQDTVAISSGGTGTSIFSADEDFTGGGTWTTGNTVSVAGVTNAAPEAVYQSERAGVFNYVIPNLTAGAAYSVRLHFAEIYFTAPGQRIFNVAINGTTVLSNFDIVAAAGPMQALVETFQTKADANGDITIAFTAGSQNQPKISGLEILPVTTTAPATPATIVTQPSNQSATVGSTATFTVVANGSGTLSYQWSKNGTAINGATFANYTTMPLNLSDSGTTFSVTVSNGGSGAAVTSATATLAVSNYSVVPGFVGVSLNNNTNGAWSNSQIYVTVVGIDPKTNQYAYLTPSGTIVDFTANDSSASNHLSQGGVNYGNYSFTLAQSTVLQIPTFISARAYISLGAPLYVPVYANSSGQVTGYAGPNPQNPTDPNVNTHFDWYEFNNDNGIFINTTQVDEFGLPLLLDVWGSGGSFHQQVGISESIAQIDAEFASEVPAPFQPTALSNLRILSPAKLSMAAGSVNGNYFDSYVATAWTGYAKSALSVNLNGRQFSGTASGSALTFTEGNPAPANVGETFVVQQPSTQDVLGCSGTMATGVQGSSPQQTDENAIQLQLQNQICAATNRGVLATPENWANASTYYATSPANFYSAFWHRHSLSGLAYGFSYDDNNDQSTTITTGNPEHMALTIAY